MKYALFVLIVIIATLTPVFSDTPNVTHITEDGHTKSIIYIPAGTASRDIARILKTENIIQSEWLFTLYLKLSGQSNRLQAGTFLLDPGYPIKRIANILSGKEKSQFLVKVTIPEGYCLTEIAALLEARGLASKTDFLTYIKTQAKLDFFKDYAFIRNNPENSLEGYLFPDTYYYSPGMPCKDILRPMLAQFQKRVMPLYEKHPTQGLSLHQLITFASIVERESYLKTEMPQIASVFYNRMSRGEPLGSDPTISYALGRPRKVGTTYKETWIDSPFNTYRRRGLPPTPIASPGIDAIQASLFPDQTGFYYFVAKGDGSHHFSRTLQEHYQAQRLYQ